MADFDIESVSGLRVIELREQLSNRGLPTDDLKEELVKRLRDAMENEQSIREVSDESSPEISERIKAVGEKEQAREERKSESEINLSQLLAAMMDMNSNLKKMKAGQREPKGRLLEEMKKTHEEMKANIVSVINTKIDVIADKVDKNEERLGEIEKNIEKNEERFGEITLEIGNLKEAMKVDISAEKSNFAKENIREQEISQDQPNIAKPNIKISTYDGKTSWQVYKTQFSIVANGNGWDPVTKARQLAASLRAEAADVLRTVPEEEQLNFEALTEALELRFGKKCLKDFSRLQLKSRQQRQTDVRDTLALRYFIDGVKDPEIQKALRLAELKDLKSVLVYSLKYEAAQQASRRDRHLVRGAEITNSDPGMADTLKEMRDILLSLNVKYNRNAQKTKVTCWRCGAEGHVQWNCQARQDQRAGNAPRTKSQEN
ncbi:CCHC-type domain-containing protein [Nephila pilipes]|uniref:CCHC-type domain-containing protein n=1 Tax=Nephila pilipes TaxID=299642 RepID=A0A8X6TDQ4_NEPPI|nr:CCHC-type domain-containing protein [Nephila pilipes]